MKKRTKLSTASFSNKDNHLNDNLYEVESVKADVEHKNPSLWDFLSYSMQNSECLICITIFSNSFVILTPSKKWKWIQTPST